MWSYKSKISHEIGLFMSITLNLYVPICYWFLKVLNLPILLEFHSCLELWIDPPILAFFKYTFILPINSWCSSKNISLIFFPWIFLYLLHWIWFCSWFPSLISYIRYTNLIRYSIGIKIQLFVLMVFENGYELINVVESNFPTLFSWEFQHPLYT